jgi:hypothetical protein
LENGQRVSRWCEPQERPASGARRRKGAGADGHAGGKLSALTQFLGCGDAERQEHHAEYEKQNEEDLGNARSAGGYTGEAKQACNQRNYKKYERPF